MTKFLLAPKWQLETPRALKEPLFLWLTAGQGRLTIASMTRGVQPHNAIYIPAGTLHSFHNMTRVQGTAIYLDQDHSRLDLPQAPVHLRLLDVNSQFEVTTLIDSMRRELDGDRPKALEAARLQLGLLSIWLHRRSLDNRDGAHTPPDLKANDRLTARFTSLLESNFGLAWNVSDYAATLGVTPTHLTRACRASCGRTALELIQRRRLYEACNLLLETKIPVQDISYRLGFSTPGYFSRSFLQTLGAPPSTFRKNRGRVTTY
ncbi:AraC family transcriptional regulator [Roseinatronobacter monicus]|uniref:AraC family transcriptional regulator n=1 Tax=Roseinatronobacter monicus TaxID=393481 RepID=UPI0011502A87|nr:AraC family transcriptional regulator [Roseinatronobacter monicus]